MFHLQRFSLRSAACAAALGLAGVMIAAPAQAVGGQVSAAGGTKPAPREIDAQKRYADGADALKASNFKAAAAAFRDVLAVSPNDGQVAYMLGLAEAGQENWKAARKALAEAVANSPDLVEARSWLGVAQVKLGEIAAAKQQRATLQAMRQSCAGACANAAALEAGLKRLDRVIADPSLKVAAGRAALDHIGADRASGAYLAAYGLINTGRYEAALGLLRRAALAEGPSADVLTYQGFANRKLGHVDAALGYYASALALAPEHRGANAYLGEYYVEAGDISRARLQLRKLEAICRFGCPEAEELRVAIARGHA